MTQPNPFAQASGKPSFSAASASNRFIPLSSHSGSNFVPTGVTSTRFPWQLPQEALSAKAPMFPGSIAPSQSAGMASSKAPVGLQNLSADRNSLAPSFGSGTPETPYDILTRWGKTLGGKLNPLAHKLVNLVFESDPVPTVENPLPIGAILPNKAFQAVQPNTSFAASRYLSISQLRKQAQSVKV